MVRLVIWEAIVPIVTSLSCHWECWLQRAGCRNSQWTQKHIGVLVDLLFWKLFRMFKLSAEMLKTKSYHYVKFLIRELLLSRWRHQMETFSALLAFCAGNSPVTGEFPAHKGQWRGALMFSLICAWTPWTMHMLVIWDATALIRASKL